MSDLSVLGGAFALVAVLGATERFLLERSRRAVPIRIHVNGTRGKSTTSRLIQAALVEGGIRALSKTTGTAARYVLPNGEEEALKRRAAANIREQVATLRRARRENATAAVIECMALQPELQWVSEREMIQSTIGVVTNARLDHVELMGRSLREIALTLGNTVPEGSVLVTGDSFVACVLAERARELGTEIILAPPLDTASSGNSPSWWAEDAGIALEVARRCGISDEVAIRGMRRAAPDPGAARSLDLASGIAVLDASAANDPESLLELIEEDGGRERPLLLVYNHRSDRLPRLASFLAAGLPGELIVTGDAPGSLMLKRLTRGLRPPAFVPRRGLAGAIAARRDAAVAAGMAAPRIVLCGNTKGMTAPSRLP